MKFATAKPHKFLSTCILLLVVSAFALQALVPAGFMPSVNKDGFTEIVICSGLDEKTILVPIDDALPSEHSKDKPSPVCAYQVLAAQKILIAPPVFVPPLVATLEMDALSFAAQNPENSSVFSFTARGPPSA